jgi:spermidine synthase
MTDPLDPAHHVKPYVHETGNARALHFSLHETQSRMRLDDPDALDLAYTRTMMGFLLFHPDPRQIAMIGLGGGSLAKFCHRHLPRSCIEVVEINRHILDLRDHFQVPPDSARFRVLHGDGAAYVRSAATAPDVLLVDGFTSDGLPARLSSQRFYDDCFSVLQPAGTLVLNLHCAHPMYHQHLDRLQRSFGGSMLVCDAGDLSNAIAFACKGPALDQARSGIVRRPRGLARAASLQLLDAFTRVRQALKEPAERYSLTEPVSPET